MKNWSGKGKEEYIDHLVNYVKWNEVDHDRIYDVVRFLYHWDTDFTAHYPFDMSCWSDHAATISPLVHAALLEQWSHWNDLSQVNLQDVFQILYDPNYLPLGSF